MARRGRNQVNRLIAPLLSLLVALSLFAPVPENETFAPHRTSAAILGVPAAASLVQARGSQRFENTAARHEDFAPFVLAGAATARSWALAWHTLGAEQSTQPRPGAFPLTSGRSPPFQVSQ